MTRQGHFFKNRRKHYAWVIDFFAIFAAGTTRLFMRLFLILFFPFCLAAQPCKKLYKDYLEPGSRLLECDIMFTFEKPEEGGFVYKRYYPETGQIIQYTSYAGKNREIPHGPHAEYWDDGKVLNQGLYEQGKKQGAWTENTLNSGVYKDGQREGTWIFRHGNGSHHYETNYMNGKEHGRSVQYDTAGQVVHEDVFEFGRRVSTTRDTSQRTSSIPPTYPECDHPDLSEDAKKECVSRVMMTNVYTKVIYPASARERGYYGKARVQFTVSKTGEIGDIQVINGICDDIKRELLFTMASLPAMKPGYQDGRPVKVKYTLPIDFRLE